MGRDLVEALVQMLSGYDRNAGPVAFTRLAETLKRRGRYAGEIGQGQSMLEAAARADNVRQVALGQRPRFRIGERRISLAEWGLDGELVRLERDMRDAVERYREQARRSLLRRLQDLPQRAFGEVAIVLLERLGLTELSVVRRPGAHGAELHLAGKLTAPSGELRAAVVVRRDGREIGRERVTELRGALHHYGSATVGWLVTAGQVLSGARDEAHAVGAAPIHLLDGLGLVRMMEEHAVMVQRSVVSVMVPDVDLLDAIKSGG